MSDECGCAMSTTKTTKICPWSSAIPAKSATGRCAVAPDAKANEFRVKNCARDDRGQESRAQTVAGRQVSEELQRDDGGGDARTGGGGMMRHRRYLHNGRLFDALRTSHPDNADHGGPHEVHVDLTRRCANRHSDLFRPTPRRVGRTENGTAIAHRTRVNRFDGWELRRWR